MDSIADEAGDWLTALARSQMQLVHDISVDL
jgi:hypothetical protein